MATILSDTEKANEKLSSDPSLSRCTDALVKVGYHHGRSGACAELPASLIGACARRHVQLHHDQQTTELGELRSQGERMAFDARHAGADRERCRVANERIQIQRDTHPYKFSALFGLFLVGLAVVLFFTDFPLSLLLVADIFDMPAKYLNAPIGQLGTAILKQSWETLFLSIGIAVFPMALKIPYQLLVATAEGSDRANSLARKAVISVMLLMVELTVSTLILLAMFRSEVKSRKDLEVTCPQELSQR